MKNKTFTTCQALALVAAFAAKELKAGEDARKCYKLKAAKFYDTAEK